MSTPIDLEPLRVHLANLIGGDRKLLPHDEASLVEEGILDSFGLAELAAFLEQTYGCRVPDQDLSFERLGSVAQIGAYIASRR
jgi:acyl carrier protein